MSDKIKLFELIKKSHKIVFFTGAGISTPSNIPDIRGNDAKKQNDNLLKEYGYPYEEIVSHDFFNQNTSLFYDYYFKHMVYPQAKPNRAHQFIKDLEKEHQVVVVTQNIDGLHQKAGSSVVYQLHGNVQENYCLKCHALYSLNEIINLKKVPHCPKCGGLIKPNVVLFNESLPLDQLEGAYYHLTNCDLVIVIGTSLVVNPAASLISYVHAPLVIINKDKTPFDQKASIVINKNIIDVIS